MATKQVNDVNKPVNEVSTTVCQLVFNIFTKFNALNPSSPNCIAVSNNKPNKNSNEIAVTIALIKYIVYVPILSSASPFSP